MAEIPNWPEYDTDHYEMRLGIPVEFSASQRRFRAGYVDQEMLVKTAEGMHWSKGNPGDVARLALWGCMSDDVDYKYRMLFDLSAPLQFEGHQLPIDVRHITETATAVDGATHPLTRIEYVDRHGDQPGDILDRTKWMVRVQSLRDTHRELLKSHVLLRSGEEPAWQETPSFGDDEDYLIQMILAISRDV